MTVVLIVCALEDSLDRVRPNEREPFEQLSKQQLIVSKLRLGKRLHEGRIAQHCSDLSLLLRGLFTISFSYSTAVTADQRVSKDNAAKRAAGKAASLPPEKANPVKAVLFAKPPVIDGKLDDEVWKTAVVLKDFYQIQPGDNLIPENRTEVMLGYDARFLYIAFHCFDDPAKVRANIPKRDKSGTTTTSAFSSTPSTISDALTSLTSIRSAFRPTGSGLKARAKTSVSIS